MGLRSFFSGDEPADPRLYRRAIVVLLGVVVFTGLAAIISFFLALRGEEPTLVPRVEGLELATALVKLQEKELYPRISLRFSDDSNTKGTILEQDPPAGAIVKAGRRIELVVSRGTAIDRIGAFSSGDALLELKSGAIEPWVGLQLALQNECLPKRLPRFALQLKPDGTYRLHEFKDPNDRNVALAAVALWHWKNNNLKGGSNGNRTNETT